MGGGGWGDPLSREPALVRRDVIEGKVSVAAAREEYGVVLTAAPEAEGDWQVDDDATRSLRDALRSNRPALGMIDRGPGYAAMHPK